MPWPAAHSGASAPADGRDEKKSEQRSSPKGSSTSGNPSVTAAPCQLPLHKGALGTGDADCRVGPAGLLAMTMVFCHSEERSDVGIRPFYDGRGFGPPYLGHGLRRPNFVPKFGASVMVIGPYGKKSKPHQPPGPAAHSEASAARSRGLERNRSRDHPQNVQQRRTIPQSATGRQLPQKGRQGGAPPFHIPFILTAALRHKTPAGGCIINVRACTAPARGAYCTAPPAQFIHICTK